MTLNRDFLTALVLLLFSIFMFITTYALPEPMFGQLASSTWPRIILIPMMLLSVILLIQSQKSAEPTAQLSQLIGWVKENKNPLLCFVLFFGFLVSMPVLGILFGGLLYVFLALNVLGGWDRALLVRHALISLVCVTSMWAIFSLVLGVALPQSSFLRGF